MRPRFPPYGEGEKKKVTRKPRQNLLRPQKYPSPLSPLPASIYRLQTLKLQKAGRTLEENKGFVLYNTKKKRTKDQRPS